MKLKKLQERIEETANGISTAKDLENHAHRLQARAKEIYETIAMMDEACIHYLNEACPELVNLAIATGNLEGLRRSQEIKEVITSFGRDVSRSI